MVDVEVYLLEMGQVKTVSTDKGSSPRRVLGLILADENLVIQRSLWSPSVEKLEPMIMEAYSGEGQDDEFPRLAFAGLELLVKPPAVNSDGQQLSTVMLKLQSLRNTTLKVICKGVPAYHSKSTADDSKLQRPRAVRCQLQFGGHID